MSASVPYYNFSGGINTEASPLNAPEGTCYDMNNIVLLRDGSARVRLGMDGEGGWIRRGPLNQGTSSIKVTTDYASKMAIHTGIWSGAGGNGDKEFTVIQFGRSLQFHDSTVGSLSGGYVDYVVDLDAYKIKSIAYEDKVEFAVGNGYLFVASPSINPFYVEYHEDTNTFTEHLINIQIRDFEGLDDGLGIDVRPATLTTNHHYNLRNQGWPYSFLCATDAVNANEKDHAAINDPVNNVQLLLGVYPSNADIITFGYTIMANGTEAFWAHELTSANLGVTPAPKGKYVVDAFRIDRSAASGIAGIPMVTEDSRPSTIAFYASRVWYSGLSTGANSSKIYFSQLVEDNTKIGKCYQDADPTSENISDLVDTDGGVINIPDAGSIKRIIAIGRSLVVLATNGIWEITGIDGSFLATGYSINKIGEQGVYSSESVVLAEGMIFFIGRDGLYRLTKEDFGTNFKVEDISSTTIQTLLNSLSPYGKDTAIGAYNAEERRIIWMFNSNPSDRNINLKYSFDRFLVFDLVLGAFYPLTINVGSYIPVIAGITTSRKYTYTADPTTVLDSSGNIVVDSGGIDVFLDTESVVKDPLEFKFLTVWQDRFDGWIYYTFSELNNQNVRDFQIIAKPGKTYSAFMEPANQVLGDAARKKQIQYIYAYFKRTEDGFDINSKGELVFSNESRCNITIKWDWSDSTSSGKWTTPRAAYRHKRYYAPSGSLDNFDYGHSVIVTKSKVRGTGQALRFRFENEPGYGFHLYGWHVFYNPLQLP